MAKQYHRSVFGRGAKNWRGMHQGYSRLEDLESFVPGTINSSPDSFSIVQRAGAVRVDSVDEEVQSALQTDSITFYAVGTKILSNQNVIKRVGPTRSFWGMSDEGVFPLSYDLRSTWPDRVGLWVQDSEGALYPSVEHDLDVYWRRNSDGDIELK